MLNLAFSSLCQHASCRVRFRLSSSTAQCSHHRLIPSLNSRTELSGAPAGDSDSSNTWRFGTSIPTAILNAAPDEQPIELRDFNQVSKATSYET